MLYLHIVGLSPAIAAETAGFEYDALGRLIRITRDDGIVIEYDYDAAGNRERKEVFDADSGGSGGDGGGPANSPPVAGNDSARIAQYAARNLNLTANDSDPDGDALTIMSVTQPSNAFVSIISANEVQIFAEIVGFDAFQYTISDGKGGLATGIVSVNVWRRRGEIPR